MTTLYIETSIVSYLRQRPSSQVVMAARQLLTHEWWNQERENYELVTSQYVIDEASDGDPVLAAEAWSLTLLFTLACRYIKGRNLPSWE